MPTVIMLAAAVSQIGSVPIAPPAPPILSPAIASQQALFDFAPGRVTCDGGSPVAVSLITPTPSAGLIPTGRTVGPYEFTFSIAADGRVYRIALAPSGPRGWYIDTPDLQPALAASRFAPGSPQASCRIRYDVVTQPIVTAPVGVIHRYLFLPHPTVSFEREISRRSVNPNGDCFTGKFPTPLLQGNADLDAIPPTPGAVSMTVVGFDIDRSGKPRNIATVTSNGDARLDAALRAATAKSRFKKGASRIGCYRPFSRRSPPPVPAPESPELAGFVRSNSGCPPEHAKWAYLPKLNYPDGFRRRGIEGWAVVRYDVAPWGQVANVSVVTSEPAAAFGEQARQIISSARRAPSDTGASGCVERVRFKMPMRDGATPGVPATAPDAVD